MDFSDIEERNERKRKKNTIRQRQRREKIKNSTGPLKRKKRTVSNNPSSAKRRKIHFNFDLNNVEEHYLGEMNFECSYCHALFWLNEKSMNSSTSHPQFSRCCSNGKVSLSPLTNLPPVLKKMLTNKDACHLEFKQSIRAYNSALAFASLGVHEEKFRKGVANFKIHGSVYHNISSLLPSDDTPKFAQIYFYDTTHEIENRMAIFENLNDSVLIRLQEMIHRSNPYYSLLKSQLERILSSKYSEVETLNMQIILKHNTEKDVNLKTYSLPTKSDIAIILPGDGSEQIETRDIVLTYKDNSIKRINELHSMYDPLHYVLLFPNGDKGWHPCIPFCSRNSTDLQNDDDDDELNSENTKFVTPKQYYAYRLHYRKTSYFYLFGRLLQQYIVDMYAKIEHLRLLYIQQHQKQIRADLYNCIQDAILSNDLDPQNFGKRVILAPSFIGGPRYMYQKYQDAMALVRKYGKPTFFITFTCNPRWREISENLLYSDSANDRIDLIIRVFNLKLKELLNEVISKKLFGEVVASIHVVEFQKRGLPHAHILIILDEKSKVNINSINNFICAEIPDVSDKALYDVIVKNMFHGPCGPGYEESPCMDVTKIFCTKRYPKDFQTETTLSENGYPLYRRRDDGRFVEVRGAKLDNRHIVPYNPYLSKLFNAHINVEYCSNITSVKYLYKYVYKGYDKAILEISSLENKEVNEIQSFVNGRYISTCEALWRIYGFQMNSTKPNVVRLPVHLENQQNVYFDEEEDNFNEVLQNNIDTKLTAWFKLNSNEENSNNVKCTYVDVPTHFTWNNVTKRWVKRKYRKQTVGRMYTVPPSKSELFYLRLLLHHVVNAKSFLDLRTINGHVFHSYQGAASYLGFVSNDEDWIMTLNEANSSKSANQLRELFATILLFCDVQNPVSIWEKFKDNLSDDIFYFYNNRGRNETPSKNFVYEKALLEIDIILRQNNKTLEDFPNMPIYSKHLTKNITIEDELPVNIEALLQNLTKNEEMLNSEQRELYEEIVDVILTNKFKVYFLEAPGGTGKTFLLNTLLKKIRSNYMVALAVASSGIAATLLDHGRTAHSRFKIPINIHEFSTCAISKQSDLAKLIKCTKLIVWDEAPMMSKLVHNCVDRTLRDILNCNLPMGGIVTVYAGDFRQILPVNKRGKRADVILSTLKYATVWPFVDKRQLSLNMRIHEKENDFSNYLLEIGRGNINIVNDFVINPNNLDNLINEVYPLNLLSSLDFTQNCILTPLHYNVNRINDYIIERYVSEEQIYFSADSLLNENQASQSELSVDFLNSIDLPGLPPHKLHLKLNIPIMLLRNLNPAMGLCNGTRLIVKRFNSKTIEAEIAVGMHKSKRVFIPRINMTPSENDLPIKFQRRQFPVKPAFAMTINKSQGQTFGKVGIYLPNPVFTHGQLYVALSRVRTKESIKICTETENEANVSNVVYTEVFQ